MKKAHQPTRHPVPIWYHAGHTHLSQLLLHIFYLVLKNNRSEFTCRAKQPSTSIRATCNFREVGVLLEYSIAQPFTTEGAPLLGSYQISLHAIGIAKGDVQAHLGVYRDYLAYTIHQNRLLGGGYRAEDLHKK